MSDIKLKTCPFCGGEAYCADCGATTALCTNEGKAAELWNRRVEE